jgi:hypothetical protein
MLFETRTADLSFRVMGARRCNRAIDGCTGGQTFRADLTCSVRTNRPANVVSAQKEYQSRGTTNDVVVCSPRAKSGCAEFPLERPLVPCKDSNLKNGSIEESPDGSDLAVDTIWTGGYTLAVYEDRSRKSESGKFHPNGEIGCHSHVADSGWR